MLDTNGTMITPSDVARTTERSVVVFIVCVCRLLLLLLWVEEPAEGDALDFFENPIFGTTFKTIVLQC